MRKTYGSVITTAVLACSSMLSGAGPASADSPGCVTHHEYHRAVKGSTTEPDAHRIFDTTGKKVDAFLSSNRAYTIEVRRYRVCGGGHVKVRYKGEAGHHPPLR